MLNRRHCLSALSALGAGVSWPALAQFRVEITGIGGSQLPLALSRFRDEDKQAQAVSSIVRSDLERSGLFRFIDPAPTADEHTRPAFPELRTRGADALVGGSVSRLADGRLDVRFKLWDVVKGEELVGQSIAVAPNDVRMAAHRIADIIHEKLTGEKGVYSTRVAYVTRSAGRFTLRLAEADGEGGQVILSSASPLISPAWSPDGLELAYVSFETRKAVVWAQNIVSGARRVLANHRGSNSAPAYSPNGTDLAVTLSIDGVSQIYLIGRDGGNLRRFTYSPSIDTEAVFAPDGRTLYFVSDRGGTPQIYRQSVPGGEAQRVTFEGNYNISPAISPDGRTLAYVQRTGGDSFVAMTMDLASGASQVISDTTDDESPSFSPNGKFIIYATRSQGREVLMTSTLDGKIKVRLVTAAGVDIREPAWGPAA